ncbi:MAG: hypothetical protein IT331_23295 [Anaerolineae bacterium]|nr:hypothetical protein [Anaerolineae bacterium]
MKSQVSDSASDRHLDTQIRAAVRVAHLMMNAEQPGDAELLMLVIASRKVEESDDMHQAMAFAVCAAQKNKHPV